jgi:hypothetical protein
MDVSRWTARPTKEERLLLGKLARADAQQAFKEALVKKGIDQFKLALRLKQGLNAYFVKCFFNSKTGMVVESKRYVDHATRLKALEMICKYFHLEPTQHSQSEIGFRGMTDEELNGRIDYLQSALGIIPATKGTGQETEAE